MEAATIVPRRICTQIPKASLQRCPPGEARVLEDGNSIGLTLWVYFRQPQSSAEAAPFRRPECSVSVAAEMSQPALREVPG